MRRFTQLGGYPAFRAWPSVKRNSCYIGDQGVCIPMAKISRDSKTGSFVVSSTLGKEDAEKFARDAKKYVVVATKSKAKANNVLKSLGINPRTGNVVKRHG